MPINDSASSNTDPVDLSGYALLTDERIVGAVQYSDIGSAAELDSGHEPGQLVLADQLFSVETITGSYDVLATDRVLLANATAGVVVATLPSAVGLKGFQFTLKKIDSSGNTASFATTSSQLIDGLSTLSIATQYASRTVVSDDSNWWIL